MERLVHEQAQVDEYIQQRQLDTVKPFSFPSPGSLLLSCAAHGTRMLGRVMSPAVLDPGPALAALSWI